MNSNDLARPLDCVLPVADSRTDSAAVCSASRADVHAASTSAAEKHASDSRKVNAAVSPALAQDCARLPPCARKTVRYSAFAASERHKRYGKPPHGYACRDRKIVPFEQFAQRGIVLPKIQHTAVKALTVAVSCTVNAPLKICAGLRSSSSSTYSGNSSRARCSSNRTSSSPAYFRRAAPGQAGRRGRCGVQDDFAQAHAVHQRTAAELTHRISQFDAFKVSAVIKCITANTFASFGA